MNILRRIFHQHKWAVVKSVNAKCYSSSLFYGTERRISCICWLEKCLTCPAERAYISDGTTTQKMNVQYFKSQVG